MLQKVTSWACACAAALAACSAWAQTAPEPAQPVEIRASVAPGERKALSGDERWRLYLQRSFTSPGSYFSIAMPALMDHLDNDPREWGSDRAGLGRRLAHSAGMQLSSEAIYAASAAALGYEPRYVRCGCSGVWARTGHALLWNFLTLDRNGRTVLNVPRIGAKAGSVFLANTWLPEGYRGTGPSLRDAGLTLSFSAFGNLWHEFAPRRKR